jgi:SPP1 gp7 family putative phage head morphogenesis protein
MIMSYWEKRFERVKALEMQKADVCKADLKKVYEEALQKCLKDVESWYQRYADENGISYADAQKILNARELKAFKMDLREYRKLAKQENLSKEYQKMLDQASIRARLTKAQEILIKTQMYCERVAKAQEINIGDTLRDVYEDSNYRAAYEIQRMKGKFETFSAVPETQVEKAINTRWAADGKDFSSRIWENKGKLVNTLRNEISRSLLLKEGTGPMAERISKQFNVSYHNAERLVETETAYVQESAMLDTYDRLGVDKYEIVATLDTRTTEICRHMDGKVFDRKGAKPGVTMPPFHCYCRSTTVPYIDGVTDDDEEKGTRASRKNGTGKTVFVSGKLTYQKWFDKYVKPHEE